MIGKEPLSYKEMLLNDFFKKLRNNVKKFGAIDIRKIK